HGPMNPTVDAATSLRIRTNSKLNLYLRVVGRRPDGYHELESIFHGIGLGDEIELEPTSTGNTEVEMELGDLAGEIPTSEENLVFQAATRLVERGAMNPGVRIKIKKNIPIAAGLGGGSGNAAGALFALSKLWGLELPDTDMLEVAGLIGSDVPYCIGGGTVLAMKRGEELTPLPAPHRLWFVLGVSFRKMLTRDVYEEWDRVDPVDNAGSAPLTFALGVGNAAEVAMLLHNDLEQAAFRLWPELGSKKQALIDAGALGAAMTGSGPTIFGVANDSDHAHEIAARIKGDFDRALVVSSHPRCVEWVDS
ncbi:MAG TPA: 4-(cytidine 5'-diphospho)-2-C-methyl-D-erythritol kinase, partial [Actinomycetota bacterium]|nr:4-(cytidine 5'-diphospho)-2-C-methyl-D-erythritol kinase [Actinomycetota bacterium]